jgi:hypothetical protein
MTSWRKRKSTALANSLQRQVGKYIKASLIAKAVIKEITKMSIAGNGPERFGLEEGNAVLLRLLRLEEAEHVAAKWATKVRASEHNLLVGAWQPVDSTRQFERLRQQYNAKRRRTRQFLRWCLLLIAIPTATSSLNQSRSVTPAFVKS